MYERTRLDLRVSPEQRAAIESAARAEGITITKFILNSLSARIQDFPLSTKKRKRRGQYE